MKSKIKKKVNKDTKKYKVEPTKSWYYWLEDRSILSKPDGIIKISKPLYTFREFRDVYREAKKTLIKKLKLGKLPNPKIKLLPVRQSEVKNAQ